jgi:hypothetical protein
MHELGHALAVRCTRGELKAVGVYPLMLRHHAGRWRLKASWGGWTSLGFIQGWPRSMSTFRRDQLSVYLAGPLASGLWAVLVLWIQDVTGSGPAWAQRLGGLCASAAVAALISVPLDLLVPYGDLRASWSLWRRDTWARQLEVLAALQLEHSRPRDWPRAVMNVARNTQVDSLFSTDLDWVVLAWAWDTGDHVQVVEALERLCARLPRLSPGVRSLVWCEVASYCALVRQDLASAQAALRRATGPFQPEYFHARLRAEASVLLLEGHAQAAFKAARAGQEALCWMEERRPAWEMSWLESFLAQAGAEALEVA